MTRGLSIAQQRALNVSGRALARDAIPDSEVYFHDDWGDNKLQNRDGSGTTTYNGVEGVYRPEWTIDLGAPEAVNQQLEINGEDSLYTDINLDFSETITWGFTDCLGTSDRDNANDFTSMTLFTTNTDRSSDNFLHGPGYHIQNRPSGSTSKFRKVDNDGNVSTLDQWSSTDSRVSYTVTRTASGGWTVERDGSTVGTASDSSHETANYIGFGGRQSGSVFELDELKVS